MIIFSTRLRTLLPHKHLFFIAIVPWSQLSSEVSVAEQENRLEKRRSRLYECLLVIHA